MEELTATEIKEKIQKIKNNTALPEKFKPTMIKRLEDQLVGIESAPPGKKEVKTAR